MDSKNKEAASIGQQIMQALTQDQVAQILDNVLHSLDEQKKIQILSALNKDISTTLSKILNPPEESGEATTRIASDEKYLEQWNVLWEEWDDISFEAGYEDGRYVNQDYDWEPPYFDHGELSDDLEEIAKKMFPLIEKIYFQDVYDDDFFEHALKDIQSSILQQPEWMGADQDGCAFSSTTANCFLQWEWLAAQSKKQNAVTFLKRIVEIDDALEILYLEDDAVIKFFIALPETSRKEIFQELTIHNDEPLWQKHLDSARSKWFRIYHAYCQSFDREQYLDACRESIDEDWTYGLALLEHLIKEREFTEAEKVVEKTVASYLNYRTNKSWIPEQSLFINFEMHYSLFSPEAKVHQLLKHWYSIAKGLGQEERTAALKIHLITYEKPFEWDAVIKVFKEVSQLQVPNLVARLFQQWQLFILNHSTDEVFRTRADGKDTWIFWLLDTGLDESKNKTWFESKVKQWLESLLQNPIKFKKQHPLIYTFTNDLAHKSSLKKEYPKLFDIVLSHTFAGKETAKSRRAWLKRMNGQQFVPLLMECWKKNVGVLVPDPADAYKSRYDEHAQWLVVVRELNPKSYQTIINQWKVEHHRRRNLWAAINKLSLPH